jgi:MFS family permease
MLFGKKDSLWTKAFLKIGGSSLSFTVATDTIYFIFPLYLTAMGFRISEIGFIAGSYTFCNLIMRLISGELIDRLGGKPMAMFGVSLFALGLLGYLMAPIPLMIIGLRLLQGIGMSLTGVCLATLMTNLLLPFQFREGMSTYGLFAAIGSLLGSVGGLFLWENTTSNLVFLIVLTITILTGIMIWTTTSHAPTTVQIQTKTEATPRFLEPTALAPGVLALLYAIPMGGIMTFLFPYATSLGIHGLTEIFLLQAGFMILTRLQTIRFTRYWGTNRVLGAGLFMTMFAFLLLTLAKGKLLFLLSAVVYGIGAGLTLPILNVMAVEKAPLNRRGKANSTYQAANDLGSGIGAFLLGIVAEGFGFPAAFIVSIVLVFFAFYLLYRGFLEPKSANYTSSTRT